VGVGSAGATNWTTSNTLNNNKFVIDKDGNVGIGTSSPGTDYKLDVAGKIQATICIVAGTGTNNASYLGMCAISGSAHGSGWASFSHYTNVNHSGYSLMQNAAGTTLLNCESGQTIGFRVANSTKMEMLSNGNLGIGTTGPAYKLDIRGTGNQVINVYSNGTGDAYARFSQNNGGTSGALLYTGATSSYCYISSRYNFPTYFLTNNTTRMVIKSNGYVGIGTTGPVVPLDVKGQIYQNVGWRAYVNSSAAKGAGWGHSGDRITIKSERDIWTQGSLLLTSDARIKENIVEIDDGFSLQKVRDISCVWYNYKDKNSRGNMRVVGFIAQQVKEHLPEAVSIQTDVVPTEMRNLENISWNSFDMSSDLQDVSGVKHRFHVSNDISGNDERMKEVIGNSDNTFTFDTSYNNVFCYGKEVDDFHILDKNKLFALNFSATQEIDRIQQVEKTKLATAEAEIVTLKNKVTSLETTAADLISRLTALESL
jgi:hypothetical protein